MSRRVLIAGLSVSLLLGACQSISDLFGTKQSAVDPGGGSGCTKDSRDSLLAALNRSCSVTSQCPSGAFCDPSVGGFCNFQCYDDTECPAGSACNCIGQCVGASTSDGGTPPDPACPRNADLIASLVATPRACTFDDACPYGMYCDTQVGKCARDCVQDSECPAAAADAGAPFCNCLGHCSTAGAKAATPAAVLPSLSVSPPFMKLPLASGATPPVKPSFDTTSFQVSIRAQGTDPSVGPVEKIHASAGRFLLIQCPAASCVADPTSGTTCPAAGSEPFVKECDLQNWVWTTNNASLLASFTLNVKPSDETPQTGEASLGSWPVKFQSNGIEGNVAAMSIGYVSTPPTSVGGTWQSPPQNLASGYAGRLTINLPGGVSFDTAVQAQPTDYGDGLVLFDPTYVMSPSGLMTIPLTFDGTFGNPSFFWLNEKLAGGQQITKGVDGWLWGIVDLVANRVPFVFQQNTQDGSIQGSFGILVNDTGTLLPEFAPNTISVSFLLKPQTVRSCRSNPGQCSTVDGYICSSGFCTQRFEDREPGFIVPMIGPSRITSSVYSDWYAPTVFSNPGAFQADVLCQYDAGAGLALDAVLSFPIQEASGDLSCVSATNPGGAGSYPPPIYSLPLLVHKDLINAQINQRIVSPPPTELGAQELFDACLADLAIRPPPVASLNVATTETLQGQQHYLPVQNNFGPGRYYDSSRSCISLGYFVAEAFNTAPNSNPRLHLRILQQWLELHSFVARQGLQTNELDRILAAAQATVPGGDPNLSVHQTSKSELIDIVTRGIAFIMSEFQQGLFDGMGYDSAVLNNPDYRQDYGGTPPSLSEHPEYEQGVGIPTTMLETATAYLDLVNAFVNDADVATYDEARGGAFVATRDQAVRVAGDASRFITEFYDLASGLHDRAACDPAFDPACASNPPPWEGRWQQAVQEVNSARARLLGTVSRVAQARNPLGIAENDVPLVFGDPQGATSQFFASSDYLLNTWAAPAVTAAQRDLSAARDAWISQQNSHLQDTLLEADRARRLEQLGEQYGGPIIEACGLTQIDGRAIEGKDVFGLVAEGKIDLSNCYVDRQRPECAPDHPHYPVPLQDAISQLTPSQVKSRLCTWSMYEDRLTLSPEVQQCIDFLASGGNGWRGPPVVVDDQGQTVNCNQVVFATDQMFSYTGEVLVDPAVLVDAEQACSKLLDYDRIPVPQIPVNCLHGKMGEAYSQITTAKNELNAASAAIAAKQVALDGQWDDCTVLAKDEDDRQHAALIVNEQRENYQAVRGKAIGKERLGDEFSWFGWPPNINLGHFLSLGSGEDIQAVNALDSELLTNYQELLVNQARGEEMVRCFNQADSLKAEVDAAKEVLTSRSSAIDSAVLTLLDLVNRNQQMYDQGAAAIAREAGRPFAGYSHDFWLDDKITAYRRDFEWARRLVYLSMRAVEYEFQESLSLRDPILAATNADQLQAVVLSLQQEQAARTINRRRPEQQSLVLSVRDDILRIPSSTNVAAGERAWSAAQKFEGRLGHPQYTVRDVNGNWLGQGLEFAIDPLAGGAQSGVALVNRCAERLWRITATIQGDSLSTTQPGSPVFLLKRNTFESQWCSGQGDGTAIQTASIQPSHSLFNPSDVSSSVDDATGFTGSALYPYFNVPRSQFYMSTYQTGSSDELAGRGLYGDYVLLFPKELIEAGFPLDNVEDVLLRFDYYSIDNLPKLSQ